MVRTERRQIFSRLTVGALVASQALFGVPVIARSSRPSDPLWTPPPPAPVVRVNRTVPKVTPAPLEPRFSDAPTSSEIFRARVFDEPLVPTGGAPSVDENRALSSALLAFHRGGGVDWHSTVGAFLATHPGSTWRASLLANLGTLESRAHRYAGALDLWDTAWSLTESSKDPAIKRIADYSMAQWLTLAASFGQIGKVRERLASLTGRTLTGSAGTRIARARETVSLIETHPTLETLCGPQAIRALIEATAKVNPRGLSILDKYDGALKGMSLLEVQALARRAGVELVVVERTDAEDVPVPSIVHWRIGHYVTVVERKADRYRIVDRARHETYWLDRDAVFSESSGYFLATAQKVLPKGWRLAPPLAAARIVGSGPVCPDGSSPSSPPPWMDEGMWGEDGNPPPFGSDEGDDDDHDWEIYHFDSASPDEPETRAPCPMCGYTFQKVTASLLLADTPVRVLATSRAEDSFQLELSPARGYATASVQLLEPWPSMGAQLGSFCQRGTDRWTWRDPAACVGGLAAWRARGVYQPRRSRRLRRSLEQPRGARSC